MYILYVTFLLLFENIIFFVKTVNNSLKNPIKWNQEV